MLKVGLTAQLPRNDPEMFTWAYEVRPVATSYLEGPEDLKHLIIHNELT